MSEIGPRMGGETVSITPQVHENLDKWQWITTYLYL